MPPSEPGEALAGQVQPETERMSVHGDDHGITATEASGNPVADGKQGQDEEMSETEARKIKELEREIMDLKIANRGKDQFIELMTHERKEIIEKLQATSRTVGQLETKIMQLNWQYLTILD